MLTLQTANITNQKAAFSARRERLTPEQVEERELRLQEKEFKKQQAEFEKLAGKKETPSTLKNVYKIGAGIAGASAVAIGSGWGLRQFVKFVKEVKASKFAKNVKEYAGSVKQFIVDSYKAVKVKLANADFYKKPTEYVKNKYAKFAKTKFGEPIAKFFTYIKEGIKTIGKKVSDGYTYVKTKIKGIDSKKAEDFAVNTVGASTGVAAGINAIKEKDEKTVDDTVFEILEDDCDEDNL